MSDPIADMLTRVRNALMRQKETVEMPYSRLKAEVAAIFLKHDFIVKVEVKKETIKKSQQKLLVLHLTNSEKPISPISKLQRLSRPGRRFYVKHSLIPRIKSGRGLVVISTDKGLMTGFEAQRLKLGGEVLCSIY